MDDQRADTPGTAADALQLIHAEAWVEVEGKGYFDINKTSAVMHRLMEAEAAAEPAARCEQTDGIGQPRWPNHRCVLAKDHRGNHEYEAEPAAADTDYPILRDGYGREFVKVPVEDFVAMEVKIERAAQPPDLIERIRESLQRKDQFGGDVHFTFSEIMAILDEVAAQPPRGSQTDPNEMWPEGVAKWTPESQRWHETGCDHAQDCICADPEHTRCCGTQRAEVVGSLTATEPPALREALADLLEWAENGPPADMTCRWCLVLRGTDPAHEDGCPVGVARSILQESGSPRGVTPALDVERLAKAIQSAASENRYDLAYEIECFRLAREASAEYARLGSPEDSDAASTN